MNKRETPFTVVASQLSEIGSKRTRNEDYCRSFDDIGLHVVCDGAGGHPGGDQASHIAAEALYTYLRDQLKKEPPSSLESYSELLESGIQYASKLVFQVGQKNPQLAGMATTLDAAWINGKHMHIGHVGDGRIYHLHDGQCDLLTEDHTFKTHLMKKGLPESQAASSEYANVLERAVGIRPTVQPDIATYELGVNDRIFLCTDGVIKLIADSELRKTILPQPVTDSAILDLIKVRGDRQGSSDNFSAIMISVKKNADRVEQTSSMQLSVHDKLNHLKSVEFFRPLEHRHIAQLLSVSVIKSFRAGTTLMQEGSISQDFWVILSGNVAIYKGDSKTPLMEHKAGVCMGETAILGKDGQRKATVKAKTDVEALIIPRVQFHQLLKKDRELGYNVLLSMATLLSEKLSRATEAAAR
jgi:serine/threonine protein phosphatase PrpC